MSPRRRDQLARELGLTADSLEALGAGWCDGEEMETRSGRRRIYAWCFPMKNAAGDVTGLRMRSTRGDKFAFTGGSGGLFIPATLEPGGRATLSEGPTDTAATWDLGFKNCFGRESNYGGGELVIELLKAYRFEELIIFAQHDELKPRDRRRPELGYFRPSQDGAARLAPIARLYVPSVRVIVAADLQRDQRKTDVRDWMHAGADASDVEALIAKAGDERLAIRPHTPRRTRRRHSTFTKPQELEGVSYQ